MSKIEIEIITVYSILGFIVLFLNGCAGNRIAECKNLCFGQTVAEFKDETLSCKCIVERRR